MQVNFRKRKCERCDVVLTKTQTGPLCPMCLSDEIPLPTRELIARRDYPDGSYKTVTIERTAEISDVSLILELVKGGVRTSVRLNFHIEPWALAVAKQLLNVSAAGINISHNYDS